MTAKKGVEKLIELALEQSALLLLAEEEKKPATFDRLAAQIEQKRSMKIKDFDTAISHFKTEMLLVYERNQSKGHLIDVQILNKFNSAQKLVEKAKELRRTRNRETTKVDANIISHAPFFLGGHKKAEMLRKESSGPIIIHKNGLRKMTYQNELGHLLTASDAKTLVGLFEIWDESGRTERFGFTEYQLCEKMNMTPGGKQYQIIRNSLEKIRHTSVILQESYDMKNKTRTVTNRFPLIIGEKLTEDVYDSGKLRVKDYELEFHSNIRQSMKEGLYTFVSIAIFDELETESAKAIYLMLSGLSGDEKALGLLKSDGRYEIPLEIVYETLFLQAKKPYKNKEVVEKGCEELKEIDILKSFAFVAEGRQAKSLLLEPSDWLRSVLNQTATLKESGNKQLKLFDTESSGNSANPLF